MPYIPQEDREVILKFVPKNPGELNFFLTKICLDYWEKYGTTYVIFNEIIGALECAKQEFYRRMVAPYEDSKVLENGDVYPTNHVPPRTP